MTHIEHSKCTPLLASNKFQLQFKSAWSLMDMYRRVRTAPWGSGAYLARFDPTHIATTTTATTLLLLFPQTQLANERHIASKTPALPPKSHAIRYPILYPASNFLSSIATRLLKVRDNREPNVWSRNKDKNVDFSTSRKGLLSWLLLPSSSSSSMREESSWNL